MDEDSFPPPADGPDGMPIELADAVRDALPADVTAEFAARFGAPDETDHQADHQADLQAAAGPDWAAADEYWAAEEHHDLVEADVERRLPPLLRLQLESAARIAYDAYHGYAAAALAALGAVAGLPAGEDGFVLLRGHGGGRWGVARDFHTTEAAVLGAGDPIVVDGEEWDGQVIGEVAEQLYHALHIAQLLPADLDYVAAWPSRAAVLGYRQATPGGPAGNAWQPNRPVVVLLLAGAPEPCGQCEACAAEPDGGPDDPVDEFDRRHRRYERRLAEWVAERLAEEPLAGRYALGRWRSDCPHED